MMTKIKTQTNRSASVRCAFTLIEILIVLALTTLLFALLLVPLVSAIKYTRQVQSLTAAQDAVRITRERLTRELSSAVFVFDGTGHRFQVPASVTVVAGDDLFTNFLNLDIPTSASGTTTVAHAYAAKLDFAMPRVNDTGVKDPTTGEAIAYGPSTSGSAVIVSPAQVFPAAAGASMVRYWVGLKDPTLPYNNNHEASANRAKNDNTYILYRAQFQPYVKSVAAGGAVSYPPETKLFALAADGKTAEIDDPDFFRYVKDTDINWLDAAHATYGATSGSAAHNIRVDEWRKIAKTVIPGPNVDLIQLPRNADNTLAYDPSGTFAGIAHSGAAHDPVSDTYFPIVSTSVTFRPGTVSGDATPATSTEYTSSGVPLNTETGLAFIPTVYTAAAQSWSLPYHVTITPVSYSSSPTDTTQPYYDTDLAPSTIPPYITAGDVLEYYHVNGTALGAIAYNATTNTPLVPSGSGYAIGGTKFVPLSVAPDSGTINFATPSLPKGPGFPLIREWSYTPAPGTSTIDLRNPDDNGNLSVLPGGSVSSTIAADNAHLVPGSIRVYGPDNGPGPNHGVRVLFTPINVNAAVPADNQFSVDYTTGIITLQSANIGQVLVVYDYQANMTLADISQPFGSNNPLLPMLVKVDYKTRDLLDISLGVRIYDVSTGRAQVLPSELKVKIGNSNR